MEHLKGSLHHDKQDDQQSASRSQGSYISTSQDVQQRMMSFPTSTLKEDATISTPSQQKHTTRHTFYANKVTGYYWKRNNSGNTAIVSGSHCQRYNNRAPEAGPDQHERHNRRRAWLSAQQPVLPGTGGSRSVAQSDLLGKQQRYPKSPHAFHVLAGGDRSW